jgi:exodeoxyribonuclease III
LLLDHLKKIEKKKPIIICGDFNVAHKEIDLARPKQNEGNPGFTPEERAWMTKFLKAGFVDVYRQIYPEKIEYTWWSYRTFARDRNIGWRIDYFCASASLTKSMKKAYILTDVYGSDHCPVGIEVF